MPTPTAAPGLPPRRPRRVLVTGAAGFIGSHLVEALLAADPEVEVLSFDKLGYAGRRDNLAAVEGEPRHRLFVGDVAVDADLDVAFSGFQPDAVVHLAAESHVDRSLASPALFFVSNTIGAERVLAAARRHGDPLVLLASTDEVYGQLDLADPPWSEDAPLRPRSPYSVSKAAADHLAQAAFATYGQPVIISRASNTYGPRQHTEKLIPRMVTAAWDHQPMPLYGDGLHVRDWLHIGDHVAGLMLLVREGRLGQAYHLGGGQERSNISVLQAILEILDRPASLITPVADRPGHDRRYALDCSRAHALGWRPRRRFEDALAETAEWYALNPGWWRGR
ncbi:MAG: dTDP-glucose 4,6-dehydratase [Deltaproteobacteria bacterium]|nr:dTDP-glucose 4,6-dehydratase [Deltaproteobacteria bacterium]